MLYVHVHVVYMMYMVYTCTWCTFVGVCDQQKDGDRGEGGVVFFQHLHRAVLLFIIHTLPVSEKHNGYETQQ